MSKRLRITIWAAKPYPPIELYIELPEDLAARIQATPVKATTLQIETLIQVPVAKPDTKVNLDKFKMEGN